MRAVVTALAAAVLALPAGIASAAWTDAATTTGTTVAAGALVPPALTCTESTGPLLSNAATVSWTPSHQPTTLTYTSRVLESGSSLTVSDNSSVQLYPALLSTLVGTTVTVRVTGTLPGTGWSTSAERTLVVGLAGSSVNCS